MKKLAIGLVLAAIVIAIAAYVADRTAQAWAAQQVDAALANSTTVTGHHGAVSYSLWRRSIDIQDVELQFPATSDYSLRAASVTVVGVGPFGTAGIQADGSVTVDLRVRQLGIENVGSATSAAIGTIGIRGLHTRLALIGHALSSAEDLNAFLAATSVERAELDELSAVLRERGGTMTIGRILVEQLKPGGLDRLAIDRAVLTTPRGSGRVAAAEIDGVAYGLGGATTAPRFFVAKARVADIALGPIGQETRIEEVLGSMTGTPDNPDGGTLTVKAVDVPAATHPLLASLGYDRVRLDLTSTTVRESGRGVIENRSKVTAANAGDLALSFRFSNYQTDAGPPDAAAMLERLRAARLDRFELHYDDASLVDRVIGFYAMNMGTDAAALRDRLIAPLEAQRASYAGKPMLAADVAAIIAFLRKPGSITIAAAPPQPLPIADLMTAGNDPEATAVKLGLTIK